MKKSRRGAFKLMIMGLLQSGQTAVQVSRDYGLNEGMIRSYRTDGEKKKRVIKKLSLVKKIFHYHQRRRR